MVRKYQSDRKPAPEVIIVSSSFQEDVAESSGAVSSENVEQISAANVSGSVKVQLLGVSARCSFSQVHNVIQSFDELKKSLVREIGFAGFLDFPSLKSMDRKFVAWLMCRVDPSSQTLHIDDNRKLKFSKEDVSKVFGIPVGGSDVSIAGRPSSDIVVRIMTHYLGLKAKDNRSIKYIQEMLTRNYGGTMSEHECSSFKVAFIIYLMSTVLAPRSKYDNAAADYWGALVVPENISSFDWSEYVLRRLMDAVVKMKEDLNRAFKCTNITGCSLFLQVLYLDSMDFGVLTMEHNIFPRIKLFSGDRVKSMIRLDTAESNTDSEGGRYGRTKVRLLHGVCYYWARCSMPDSADNMQWTNVHLWEICASLARVLSFPAHTVRAIYSLVLRSGTRGGISILSGILEIAERYGPSRKRSRNAACNELGVDKDLTGMVDVGHVGVLPNEIIPHMSVDSASAESSCGRFKRTRMESETNCVTEVDVSVDNVRDIVLHQVGSYYNDVPSRCSAGESTQMKSNYVGQLFEKLRLFASSYDASRPFLMHPLPKYIEVFHDELQNQFSGICEIEADTFDAILRSFNHREGVECFANGSVRRRHYVENDFMRFVLDGNVCRFASHVRDLFSGDHLRYDVERCQLFFFPARLSDGWICFCWDCRRSVISVFDPLNLVHRHVNSSGVLGDVVQVLKQAVCNFAREGGLHWLERFSMASSSYISVDAEFDRKNLSGVMCAFFCRNYDGTGKFEDFRTVHAKDVMNIIANDIMLLLETLSA